jgi:Transposase IS200 like
MRAPRIIPEIEADLHAYLGGIVREIGGVALCINGMADHVHLLVRMPSTHSMADLARLVKTNSSRWVHERWPQRKSFGWQTGYGAFSVSESGQNAGASTSCTNNNITLGDHSRKSLLCFSRRTTSRLTANICGVKSPYAPSGLARLIRIRFPRLTPWALFLCRYAALPRRDAPSGIYGTMPPDSGARVMLPATPSCQTSGFNPVD